MAVAGLGCGRGQGWNVALVDDVGIVDAVEDIVEAYVDLRQNGERLLDTVRRTGVAPFKERVYADH